MIKKKYRDLFAILVGSSSSNIWLFSAIILINIISSLFEGASFAFLIMGFGAINNQTDINPLGMTYLENLAPHEGYPRFVFFIFFSMISQVFRSLLAYVALYGTSIVSLRIQADAQYKVYDQIFKLSFPCVSKYKVGDLTQYASAPTMFIPPFMESINKIIVSLSLVSVTIFGMFCISASMSLCAGIVLGLLILGQKYIIKKIMHISNELANHMAEFSKQTVQSLEGLRLIHSFNEQSTVLKKISNLLKQIANSSRMLSLWNNSIPSINELTGVLSIGVILLMSLYFFKDDGAAGFSLLLTFVALTYRLSTRLQVALTAVGAMATYSGHVNRINTILSTEGKEFCPTGGRPFKNFAKGIQFNNVTLSYSSTKSSSLKDISFSIPKGKITAFVGASGGGKSSIMDLLLRLYTPTEGKILVDGSDLIDFEVGSWRDLIGVVSQDTFTFNETIEENIRFGKPEATLDEVIQAAQIAGAHEFIDRIPDKYQALIGERGYKLSGGERQRIALARAILRDPQILILDEATSNLDSHSEHLILKALETFCKNRTTLVVAHRLSTIISADQILVIDKGRLIEQGTHEQLLAQKGQYAGFWAIQSHKSNSRIKKQLEKTGVF